MTVPSRKPAHKQASSKHHTASSTRFAYLAASVDGSQSDLVARHRRRPCGQPALETRIEVRERLEDVRTLSVSDVRWISSAWAAAYVMRGGR